MIAVLKHELRNYFTNFTAYIFGAFLLVIIGVGAMIYNIQYSISNFEYVLSFSSIIFVVIIPLLTMKVIAEERKQKTDQLLYSLPISTTKIVFGKYLALLIIYLIPFCIISIYPLIFSKYGEVYLLTSYCSLIAFFFVGAALIALGVFISSLTDNQGFAAGISVATILFNYFSVRLAEYVSATAVGSVITILIAIILIGIIIHYITKNNTFAYATSFGLLIITGVLYLINSSSFEGLVPNIIKKLSLFERLNTFVNGMFDLTAIVFFLSVVFFFIFLTVQSLEKRRYN